MTNSTIDWISVISAIGQCGSALGAMIAAFFAYITIREMQKQSNLQKDELRIRYGPKLHVDWQEQDQITNLSIKCFPTNEQDVSRLTSKSERNVFEVLSKWWTSPSPKAFPKKYLNLIIQNIQAEPILGTAKNIRGSIELFVKNPNNGHPPHHYCRLNFNIPQCKAKDKIEIPFRVEGSPEFSIKILLLEYNADGSSQKYTDWSGNQAYSFQ